MEAKQERSREVGKLKERKKERKRWEWVIWLVDNEPEDWSFSVSFTFFFLTLVKPDGYEPYQRLNYERMLTSTSFSNKQTHTHTHTQRPFTHKHERRQMDIRDTNKMIRSWRWRWRWSWERSFWFRYADVLTWVVKTKLKPMSLEARKIITSKSNKQKRNSWESIEWMR